MPVNITRSDSRLLNTCFYVHNDFFFKLAHYGCCTCKCGVFFQIHHGRYWAVLSVQPAAFVWQLIPYASAATASAWTAIMRKEVFVVSMGIVLRFITNKATKYGESILLHSTLILLSYRWLDSLEWIYLPVDEIRFTLAMKPPTAAETHCDWQYNLTVCTVRVDN